MDMECMSSPETVYNVVLHCTKTGESEKIQIKVQSPPVNILEVKEQIEKHFSIPVCVQTLSYEGYDLRDDALLSSVRIRDGDIFHVEYLGRGHCSEIKEFVCWLKQVLEAMKLESSADLENLTSLETQHTFFRSLWDCFWAASPAVEHASGVHFLCMGGLQVAVDVQAVLLQSPWGDLSLNMKYLESSIAASIRGIGGARLSRIVAKLIGSRLALWIQGFLRVKVEEGKSIRDYELSTSFEKSQLEHIICGSAVILNILIDELPECRVDVASNKDVLHQLSCLLLSPLLKPRFLDIVSSIFLTLSFTSGTHKYITDSVFIKRLLQASARAECSTDPNEILLWYFTCLFFAHICLVSPHCIESEWHHVICNEIERFLSVTSTSKIVEIEAGEEYIWTTFLPTIKVVFVPNTPQDEEGPIRKLQLASLKLILFCLQANLSRDIHREVLLKEELLDYVTCMPQYVPASLRPQAKELVRMVASSPDIPESPPKLLNLVKARLAKMHFGLEQVLSLSVSEVINAVL